MVATPIKRLVEELNWTLDWKTGKLRNADARSFYKRSILVRSMKITHMKNELDQIPHFFWASEGLRKVNQDFKKIIFDPKPYDRYHSRRKITWKKSSCNLNRESSLTSHCGIKVVRSWERRIPNCKFLSRRMIIWEKNQVYPGSVTEISEIS